MSRTEAFATLVLLILLAALMVVMLDTPATPHRQAVLTPIIGEPLVITATSVAGQSTSVAGQSTPHLTYLPLTQK